MNYCALVEQSEFVIYGTNKRYHIMVFCVSLFVTWLVIMALSTFITHVSAFSIILHYGIWCCIIATLRLSLMLYIIGIKVDIAVFILQWHYYDPSRGFYLNIFCMDKTNLVVLIGFITLLTFWSISWILSHGLPVTASGTQVIFICFEPYLHFNNVYGMTANMISF